MGDEPDCFPNCEPPPPNPLALRSPSSTEGRAVLSAREEKLYIIRGDARTRRGAVWVHDVVHGTDVQVRDARLGRVLAATYRPLDRSLYVLDEVALGHRGRARRARLVRIDAAGAVTKVQSWPRLSYNTQFELAADTAGSLWVLAWERRRAHAHVVLRLEPRRRRWRPTGWAIRAGAPARVPPRTNSLGLSYIVRRGGDESIVGIRPAELRTRGRVRCF